MPKCELKTSKRNTKPTNTIVQIYNSSARDGKRSEQAIHQFHSMFALRNRLLLLSRTHARMTRHLSWAESGGNKTVHWIVLGDDSVISFEERLKEALVAFMRAITSHTLYSCCVQSTLIFCFDHPREKDERSERTSKLLIRRSIKRIKTRIPFLTSSSKFPCCRCCCLLPPLAAFVFLFLQLVFELLPDSVVVVDASKADDCWFVADDTGTDSKFVGCAAVTCILLLDVWLFTQHSVRQAELCVRTHTRIHVVPF